MSAEKKNVSCLRDQHGRALNPPAYEDIKPLAPASPLMADEAVWATGLAGELGAIATNARGGLLAQDAIAAATATGAHTVGASHAYASMDAEICSAASVQARKEAMEDPKGDGGSSGTTGRFWTMLSKPKSFFTSAWDKLQQARIYVGSINLQEHQQRSHQEAARYAAEAWKETEMKRIEHETELQLSWIRMQAEQEQRRQEDARQPEYRCATCRAIFVTQKDRDEHSVVHASKQQFRCSLPNCFAFFEKSDALARHEEAMHGRMNQMIGCPYVGCIDRFADSQQLVHHLENHSASLQRSPATGNC